MARGFCASHYRMLRETGSVGKLLADTPIQERFWKAVSKTESCWMWTKSLEGGGYGVFTPPGGFVKAHRYSYELANGPIPEGKHIDHLCHVRACVNPEHLQAVTQQENNENTLKRRDNTSGFRGVSWHKATGRWMAYGQHKRRNNYLGLFDSAEEAADAAREFRSSHYSNNREEPI